MRRTFGVVALVLLLLAMTVPVGAQVTETTLPPVDSTSTPPEMFTICHFAGLEGTEMFVELTLPFLAIFGEAGHFFENGTPRAGHEEDIFGPCPVTTTSTSTTTSTTTTTTSTTTTTTIPVITPFCVDVNTATALELEELDGISALLALAIIAGRPYESVQDLADVLPPGGLALILIANAQTGAFADDTCLTPLGTTTTTTTTLPDGSTTTTTLPTTTLPPPGVPFAFGAATTVCVAEVPTIRISFQNTFPDLAGQTGVLTMTDINGNVVSTQDLVYEPGTTVDLLYPGTSVNADGSIDDVPGWILTDDGFWIRDPSDEFLREGINLTYEVNPTATAFVTYPPESSECANPDNPVLTIPPSVPPGITSPPRTSLPFTGFDPIAFAWIALILAAFGGLFLLSAREDG